MHPRGKVAVAEHGVLGMAGDEQHREIGTHRPGSIRQLPAIHATRQSNIREQQVDARAGSHLVQAGHGVFRIQGGVAVSLQHIGHQHAYGRFVVHDQHRLAVRDKRNLRHVSLCLRLSGFVSITRQIQANRRALPWF